MWENWNNAWPSVEKTEWCSVWFAIGPTKILLKRCHDLMLFFKFKIMKFTTLHSVDSQLRALMREYLKRPHKSIKSTQWNKLYILVSDIDKNQMIHFQTTLYQISIYSTVMYLRISIKHASTKTNHEYIYITWKWSYTSCIK
jgi:hypothetical protein